MRVLVLLTRLPHPPWRGDQVRAWHLLRVLAPRHEITVVALVLRRPGADDVRAVEGLGVRVEVVPLGLTGAVLPLARVLRGDRTPLQVLLYDRRAARARVGALLRTGRFDVVHAQLVRTCAYLPGANGPPVVVDLVDALSANFARRATLDRGPARLVARLEAVRLAAAERAVAQRAARVLVVSEAERDRLRVPGVVVVPNGVDPVRFPPRAGAGRRGRIVFAGNLGYFPNADAAVRLAERILPLVRRIVPDAGLVLAGARPTRRVRALARRPGVIVRADVPDLARELADAAVAVIPIRAGSGLQNKLLEAMAVGVPVVTTPDVAGAAGARDGVEVLVADTDDALAAATGRLLRDEGLARALGERGRALVQRAHRWGTSADLVEAAWAGAVAHRP